MACDTVAPRHVTPLEMKPTSARASDGAAAAHSDTTGGRLLAGHRLVRPLGKGGLGEVFEAVTPDGRTVAIKAFAVSDDDQGLIAAAFVREANLGERLDHPDIVKVLTSGCEGEYAYLVMELVPGHDLRQYTVPGQLLPLSQVLLVAERVAGALAAAHAIHVIHRDIKPGNVLVDWSSNTVKVTDFGLARLGDAFRSRTGIIAGTPGYMSPEQLAESTVGPASDLYSLGVLLFELLTGRLPHQAATLGALLVQAVNKVAPPVSAFHSGLPPALVELVAELLDKRPERRPRDAESVANRLQRLRHDLPSDPAMAPGPKSRG
jgi:eukaryotic-like serine/threonine-protein kinase